MKKLMMCAVLALSFVAQAGPGDVGSVGDDLQAQNTRLNCYMKVYSMILSEFIGPTYIYDSLEGTAQKCLMVDKIIAIQAKPDGKYAVEVRKVSLDTLVHRTPGKLYGSGNKLATCMASNTEGISEAEAFAHRLNGALVWNKGLEDLKSLPECKNQF